MNYKNFLDTIEGTSSVIYLVALLIAWLVTTDPTDETKNKRPEDFRQNLYVRIISYIPFLLFWLTFTFIVIRLYTVSVVNIAQMPGASSQSIETSFYRSLLILVFAFSLVFTFIWKKFVVSTNRPLDGQRFYKLITTLKQYFLAMLLISFLFNAASLRKATYLIAFSIAEVLILFIFNKINSKKTF